VKQNDVPKIVSVLAVVLALCFGWPALGAWGQEVVRVKGSNIMANSMEGLAKSFMIDNSGTTVVVSGGGAQVGIDELLSGAVEIAMSSRRIENEELAGVIANSRMKLTERFVGWSGVAVIRSPDVPVEELTLSQVHDIFIGGITNWNRAGGPNRDITVFVQEAPRSGAAVFFQRFVLKGKAFSARANVRRYARTVIKLVAQTDGAIGFAPLDKALQAAGDGSIGLIAIKKSKDSPAVPPTRMTVADRSYPIIMPLFLYYDSESETDSIRRFVEYCAMKGLEGR
jgi:phosphate transport system substrate-binding protein